MAQCDYWWYTGDVEWCDLVGSGCKCGGWDDRCALKGRRKLAEETQRVPVRHHESRQRQMKHANNSFE